LTYKNLTIKYNFMYLNSNSNSKQFAFGPELPELGKFGIYELNMIFCNVESEEEGEQEEGRDNRDMGRDRDRNNSSASSRRRVEDEYGNATETISFSFKVHSFNVPFIIRQQVPLWVLCLASFAISFARLDEIANIYGNIILVSVAQIGLLSNFRQTNFKTEYGGLYEITLGGFIVISLLQMVIETRQFYSTSPVGQISQDDWFFQLSYIIGLVLLFVNFSCLMLIGCRRKSQHRSNK
jgi:hypothetical protein